MARPVEAIGRIKAEREFRKSLESPAANQRDFDPAHKVAENIADLKRFFRDNVEMKAPTSRPSTSKSLAQHATVWEIGRLHQVCTKKGVAASQRMGSRQHFLRDINEFTGTHLPDDLPAGGLRGKSGAKRTASGAGMQRDRPMSAKVSCQTSVNADATLMRYILGYMSLRKTCRELPKTQVARVMNLTATPDGWDVGGRGNLEMRVIRERTFEVKVQKIGIDPPKVFSIYRAMDVFSDSCVAHKPFQAAIRCVHDPTAEGWIALNFVALATHNAPLHISEYHASESFLVKELISEGQRLSQKESTVYVPKWRLRNDDKVVEFQALKAAAFAECQSIGWKELRVLIMEKFPALTEILVKAKL